MRCHAVSPERRRFSAGDAEDPGHRLPAVGRTAPGREREKAREAINGNKRNAEQEELGSATDVRLRTESVSRMSVEIKRVIKIMREKEKPKQAAKSVESIGWMATEAAEVANQTAQKRHRRTTQENGARHVWNQ